MEERLQNRLEELRKDFATGQERLKNLQMQQAVLQETLLRISGAIQVLEELRDEGGVSSPNGPLAGEAVGPASQARLDPQRAAQ